jgi:hypothetical protein
MAITSTWYNNEKTIIITRFETEWIWNDFHKAVREMHEMIRTVPHRVDLIMLHKVDQPLGNPMIHFRKAFENQPDNTGQVVVVNSNLNPVAKRFMNALAGIFDRAFPSKSKVYIVDSIDEAEKLIAKSRVAIT